MACAVGIVSTHPVCCQCPRHLNDFCKTRSTGPASKRPRAYRLRRRTHFGHLTCVRLQALCEGVLASVDTERHDVCMRRRRGFSFLCRGGPCHLTDFALKSAENDARFATRVGCVAGFILGMLRVGVCRRFYMPCAPRKYRADKVEFDGDAKKDEKTCRKGVIFGPKWARLTGTFKLKSERQLIVWSTMRGVVLEKNCRRELKL